MPIALTCAACTHAFNAPTQTAGLKVACPRCKTSIRVPGQTVPVAGPPEPVDLVPFRPAAERAQGLDGRELERFVRSTSWTFGERTNHPYKIWCDEVRRQLRIRKPVDRPMPLFDRE